MASPAQAQHTGFKRAMNAVVAGSIQEAATPGQNSRRTCRRQMQSSKSGQPISTARMLLLSCSYWHIFIIILLPIKRF
ncbi:hypothetical protein ACFWP0_03840 [Achromobacter sp. NPDC058515]|uniref:hypothetical protein n=1 Tax=Achromobacter sp. NPDC058515 TaxID=3346533 RepID=UPI00365B2DCC